MVLLIIDAQKGIVNNKLYSYDKFIENVKLLIKTARENHIEVIYIRHDDGEGELLSHGNHGFEIYEGFRPMENEQIYDKNVNSCFKETGLLEYLGAKSIKRIIVAGLQTDYCIDAAVKCGFEHGFKVIVPEYANSTFDNQFMTGEESYRYYNEFMWKGRYAECVSVSRAVEMMRG